ncbi:MAG: SMC-Scp complex subunit ScpB [Patescibacteria group bacterium]
MHNLRKILEAILFYKSEPVTIAWLAKVTKREGSEINEALIELENTLAQSDGGIILVRTSDHVQLGTSPDAASTIEQITKDELSGELGKAGVEALSIILYQGPISRTKIDYIRGVNSQFTVRHLMVRGLIDRIPNPEDSRSYLYQPTIKLLTFMGLAKIEDLPDYEAIRTKLNAISIDNPDNN